jgi:pyridoxine 4-dehydrogenase
MRECSLTFPTDCRGGYNADMMKLTSQSYSPLGRGFLTGQIKSADDLPEGDFRRMLPRFQPQNFETNLKLVEELKTMAAKKGCNPGQLALGWLLAISEQPGMPKIIPIPGTTKPERVRENANAVQPSDEEMNEIKTLLQRCEVKGDRYPEVGMKFLDS